MAGVVFKWDAPPDRDRIQVGDREFEIRGPDDLTMEMVERMSEFESLADTGFGDSAGDVKRLNDMMVKLLTEVVFLDPPDVGELRRVGYTVMLRWVDFFIERSEVRSKQIAETVGPAARQQRSPRAT